MNIRTISFVLLMVAGGLCPLLGQSKPRIAVIPLNPISMSKQEAEAITGLLETGLVKTEAYEVIEQRQIQSILEAQEQSLSECTDEKCAIQFGKMLAAEQIVLGSVASLGGKYVLNAKVIDVTTSKNLKADTQEFATLGDVTQAAETLAFKLAGLTITRGEEVQIARQFGELFVQTDPAGADILINGVLKGKSPELLSRIPLGKIRVEAKLETQSAGKTVALYAAQDVEVTAKMGTLNLKLEQQYTNLFIKSSQADVVVYLDGQELGVLGAGLFPNLPAGEHAIELKGAGLYWTGTTVFKAGESARVEARPREFGAISYVLPEGASAEIASLDYRQVVRGAGTLDIVWAGRYTVNVSGDRFEGQILNVTVNRNQTATLNPSLKLTRAAQWKEFDTAIAAVEKAIGGTTDVPASHQADIDRIQREVRGAGEGFADLLVRADKAVAGVRDRLQKQDDDARVLAEARQRSERLAALTSQRDTILAKLQPLESERKSRGIGALVWLGLAAGSGAGAAVGRLQGNSSYDAYGAAQTTAEAVSLREKTRTMDIVFIACSAGAGVSLIASLISAATRPVVSSDHDALRNVESQIQELK